MFSKFLRLAFLIIIYILMMNIYTDSLSTVFNYEGFKMQEPDLRISLINYTIVFLLIIYTLFIRNQFYSLIYNIYLTLFVFGQSIYGLFNDQFIIFIYSLIPLIPIILLDRFDSNKTIESKKIDINNKYIKYFLVIVAISSVLPYLNNITSINIRNLLLIDIYETRGLDSNTGGIMGYLISPIARVIFPFFLVYFLRNKRYVMTMIFMALIIMMFLLNGAVKSILMGGLIALIFSFSSYKNKNLLYLFILMLINTFGIIMFKVAGSISLLDYIRRVFFTPANLYAIYRDYFQNNFTYFSHSRIADLLGFNSMEKSIPLFIGENVLGIKGRVSNVGIFVEGYFSFGLIGVVIISILFGLLIFFIKKLGLNSDYFGLFFVYIYIINTSFIETLLITHGLLFYLIWAYYIIPKDKKIKV